MSCTNTGRANHTLLKKDCIESCRCFYNTAYSCAPVCCEQENNSVKLTVPFTTLCTYFETVVSEATCEGLLAQIPPLGSQFPDPLPPSIPAVHCSYTITYRNVTDDCNYVVFTVENRVVTSVEDNIGTTCEPDNGQELQVLINGKVCLTCTI